MLSNVRLSFPNLVEPQRKVNETTGEVRTSYNCALLMPPDDPGFAAFMKQYAALAADKWKEHANQIMQMVHTDRKTRCYANGSETVNRQTLKPYAGYDGMMVISASSKHQPQVMQPDGNKADPANTMLVQQLLRKLYGGCRVNVALKPWLQENKHGRGIRCDLIAVQFARDDQPFGAGEIDATSLFGQVAESGPVGPVTTPAAMPPMPFATAANGIPGLPPFLTS